jgi:hypothetical protein
MSMKNSNDTIRNRACISQCLTQLRHTCPILQQCSNELCIFTDVWRLDFYIVELWRPVAAGCKLTLFKSILTWYLRRYPWRYAPYCCSTTMPKCILGAFTKLPKASINFVMSVRLSVRAEQRRFHWTGFPEIWYLCILRKSVEKIQDSLNMTGIANTLREYQRTYITVKGKGLPQQAEVAQGVPGRLRPRIFLTFGTTRVVGRQPCALAAFTPGKIPGTHF